MPRFLYCLVILSLFALTACMGGEIAPEPEPLTPLTAFMVAAQEGESAELDDPLFGGAVRVSHEGSFSSANNEDCRRASVLARGHAAEVVVICRSGTGSDSSWKMAPRIMGANHL